MSNNSSRINSIEALQREQQLVRNRIKQHEVELRKKLQELPGELAVVGANTFIPKILRGKVTNTALNGGKFLINKFFVDSDDQKFLPGIKKPGVFSVVKKVFRMFKGKK